MKKTMKIEGMMCPHCEARVKKCLEEMAGVSSAEVSHEAGTAIVVVDETVTDEALKTLIEGEGYKVLDVQ